MLAEIDGQASSNGTARVAPNGTNASSALRAPGQPAANGTHKNGNPVNGSSQNGKGITRLPTSYYGHDRGEVTRILIQALADMGYHSAAQSVSRDSGQELEIPTVVSFRSAVLDGNWAEAEQLLFGAITADDEHAVGNGLILAPGADKSSMRFWLREQKFLELLEQRDHAQALAVLRKELTPLYQDTQRLHFLSSLLMCPTPGDLMARAGWDGASGQSRELLLSDLSRMISPSVMLPEHRLAVLLQQVKDNQINHCLYHSSGSAPSLYSDHICSKHNFPSEIVHELDKHAGEIWQIRFSHDGTRLATCGSDRQVVIYAVPSFDVVHKLSGHDRGVGDIAWSPSDSMLVTCGRDRQARLWDTETGALLRSLEKIREPVSGCVWAADGQSFIIGSLDKDNSLVQWDVEGNKMFQWTKKHRVEDLAIAPNGRWLVAKDDMTGIHVYNVHSRELEYETEFRSRLTSVDMSHDSRFVLVNNIDGEAQLIDIMTRERVQKYVGHKGGDYVIRSAFGGASESFVMSGSEDGYLFIWHKPTGVVVEKLDAHHPRCNSVSWNPSDAQMFASCGDDGKIKIWSTRDHWRELNPRRPPFNGASRTSNGWRADGLVDD